MHDVITMTDSMRSKYARTHSMQALTSMPMVSDVSGQILKQMMSSTSEAGYRVALEINNG